MTSSIFSLRTMLEVEVEGDLSEVNSFGLVEGAPSESIVDNAIVVHIGDIDGILFVVMLTNEEGMRAYVEGSAMSAPKSSLALHVDPDVKDDASCIGVVVAADVNTGEGFAVGVCGVSITVMS